MERNVNAMLRALFTLTIFIGLQGLGSAHAQDYEREKRWADEVVPGLVVGDAVQIDAASGKSFLALYAKGADTKPALVIVHGVGVHPDHGVIGIMRTRLNDLGYTTLAIQMPVLGKDKGSTDYFPATFPDASDRIAKAAAWLTGKGHKDIILISHSMGSWMSNVYLDQATATPYRAWVCMGLTGGFRSRWLGIDWPMLSLDLPILDVYGEKDLVPSVDAAGRRARSIAGNGQSRQVRIEGADHFYVGRERKLAEEIDGWVKGLPK